MKKFYFLAAILALAVSFTSCKTAQFGVAYAVTVVGDGDGQVDVSFPQGRFAMDGTAGIDLRVSNDTNVLTAPVTCKAFVLNENDPQHLKALRLCNDFMEQEFVVNETEAGGTYDILIKGFVRETLTGIGFEVEKHLTNRANAPSRVTRVEQVMDAYPYIH